MTKGYRRHDHQRAKVELASLDLSHEWLMGIGLHTPLFPPISAVRLRGWLWRVGCASDLIGGRPSEQGLL